LVRASKTIVEGKHLYINILDFKDEAEQELYYKKIQQLIKESQGRVKVY